MQATAAATLSNATTNHLIGLVGFTVSILAGIALLALFAGRRAPAPAPVDDAEDRARGRRIADDDTLWLIAIGDRPRPIMAIERPALTVDPVVPDDVAAHVAPGAGSVASVAATAMDTKLRDSVGRAILAAAEVAAHAEETVRADARFFAVFRLRMDQALGRFEASAAVGRADMWLHYEHDIDDAHCKHCAEAVAEISGEYREMVAGYDTQAWDARQLRAELAAA